MRPTPEGVGNGGLRAPRAPGAPASMRPTPEGVGNSRGARLRPAAGIRFNEAHARRRGKWWRSREKPLPPSSFNEAHARRRGKSPMLPCSCWPYARASMRPTPEGVGNGQQDIRLGGVRAASMRPTPEGVGNHAGRDGRHRRVIASMRPTPEGVGNGDTVTARRLSGAGFNEAHARRRGKCCSSRRPPSRVSSFNEAHARRRGKSRRVAERGCSACRASMRPTPEGVGNPDILDRRRRIEELQ